MKNKIPAPLAIAHRGFSAKFPENTLVAFRAALKERADMIECDLQLTSDDQIVITHDYELGRCTPGRGSVASKTYSRLAAVSSGAWMSKRFKDERVPLLHDLLQLARGTPTQLNLEIKGKAQKNEKDAAHFVREVFDTIDEANESERVLISSFEPLILKLAHAENKKRKSGEKIRLAILNHYSLAGETFDRTLKFARDIQAYSYHPHFRELSFNATAALRAQALKIYPYTANEPREFALLLALGVDGIITNELRSLQRYLRKPAI